MNIKEIGSNFWMNVKHIETYSANMFGEFEKHMVGDVTYFSSGRGAIEALIKQYGVEGKKVLVPIYCCHTVFEPFIKAGCSVTYYQINKDLTVNIKDLFRKIQERVPQYILVMSYFGKDTLCGLKPFLEQFRKQGIKIIEDLTQSMFSDCKYKGADFYVGSFRKWGPITDGGYLIAKEKPCEKIAVTSNEKLIEAKKRALQKKYEYMELGIGDKEEFLQLQRQAENLVDNDNNIYAMSDTGRKMLSQWKIEEIKIQRRENYNQLLREMVPEMCVSPVLRELKDNEVPLYFMVYCEKERSVIQSYLAKRNIYAPVIWPLMERLKGMLSLDGKYIYSHILALPCDQRYTEKDMKRIIDVLQNFK